MAYDPTKLDPSLDPSLVKDLSTANAEAGVAPFTPDTAGFAATATKEIQPYYQTLLSGFDTQQANDLTRGRQSYKDILTSLNESYNKRGMFFSGEAVAGTNKLGEQQAQNEAATIANYGTKRAGALLDQTQALTQREAQLKDQAYQDYVTRTKVTVDAKVASDLAAYLPGHADYLKQQLADANSPWLDIPLEDSFTLPTTTAPAAPSSATAKGSYGRWLTPAEAKSGKYKGKVVVIPGHGIRFKTPADEPKMVKAL